MLRRTQGQLAQATPVFPWNFIITKNLVRTNIKFPFIYSEKRLTINNKKIYAVTNEESAGNKLSRRHFVIYFWDWKRATEKRIAMDSAKERKTDFFPSCWREENCSAYTARTENVLTLCDRVNKSRNSVHARDAAAVLVQFLTSKGKERMRRWNGTAYQFVWKDESNTAKNYAVYWLKIPREQRWERRTTLICLRYDSFRV